MATGSARGGIWDHGSPVRIPHDLLDVGVRTSRVVEAVKGLDPKVEDGGLALRREDVEADADSPRRIALSQLHLHAVGHLQALDERPCRRQTVDVVIDDLDGCQFSSLGGIGRESYICSTFVESGSSSKPYPVGTGIGSFRSGASGIAVFVNTSVNSDHATSPPANKL